MAVEAQAPRVNGLKTAWDTIVAPKEAFESIRQVPTWGWALAISIVLAIIGNIMVIPATQHAISSAWPGMVAQNPNLTQLSAQQQQAYLNFSLKMVSFGWIFVIFILPIFALVGALVMLVFDKLGGGDGSFGRYFAAECNIFVPAVGISSLLVGIIATLRGADSFTTSLSVQQALPSLALLAPSAGVKLSAFLGSFSPFSIWATALAIAALRIVGRVRPLQAWLGGIVLFLVPALAAVVAAK